MRDEILIRKQKKFIEKAKEIHGDKYDYSLVSYEGSREKVKIICPKHGILEQTPKQHFKTGCIRCNKQERLIEKAKEIHGDKYDYSLVCYKGVNEKVKIICPKHGVFEDKFCKLLERGCVACNKQDKFINKAREIHGEKYDYSLVVYKETTEKVKIICPKHGVFEQTPKLHYKNGCRSCSLRMTTQDAVEKIKAKHGDKFDYSLVRYESIDDNLKIICPKHGIFEKSYQRMMTAKTPCPKCLEIKPRPILDHQKFTDTFIERAKKIHGDKYDYSLVEYKNNYTKVKIICSKHGVFEQTPTNHYHTAGCTYCGKNYQKENWMREVLESLFSTPFPSVRPGFLKRKKTGCNLELDCFSDVLKLAVEYQGTQHYESVEFFDGDEGLRYRQDLDKIKTFKCLEEKIILWKIDGRRYRGLSEKNFKDKVSTEIRKMALSNIFTPKWMPQQPLIESFFLTNGL